MYSLDFIFRVGTILCYVIWRWYWRITELKTEKAKPKEKITIYLFSQRGVTKLTMWALYCLNIFQLAGWEVLPIRSHQLFIQAFGFSLVLVGLVIAFRARADLGVNWANAYEYQVKRNHELVTSGIYAYIRHPIYTGIGLFLLGGQLVSLSYLVVFLLPFLAVGYIQAKKEEELLTKHFGKKYTDYMKTSKMFLPFVF